MPTPRDTFLAELRRSEIFIKKQRSLRLSGHLSSLDLKLAYEITFLSSFVSFENFIEEQFIGLILGKKLYKGSPIYTRITAQRTDIARQVVYHGRSYTDFIPYENTLKLAKIYFRNGHPFTLLGKSEKESIRKFHIIRNAIAHKSRASKASFKKDVLQGLTLRRGQRSPGGYLSSQFSINTSRFEHHISELINISNILS